ncbi:MAG: LuxR C-terminal-related transcriptional regulator [Waterburya sp.]
MSNENNDLLINPTRLLLELQNINLLIQSLSGCLEPETIAKKITDSLVDKFNCAFVRIWIVESDRTSIRLVASSGLYTRIDGDFASVPMGAYKVGKIAQTCNPFLSNQLAKEPWVKDREWAIANKICGFAGLPLAIGGQAIGVLAVFSHQSMQEEFLEALRILCGSVAVALKNALLYQQKLQAHSQASALNSSPGNLASFLNIPLSEQISAILTHVRLILVGTEKPLNISHNYILLKTAEVLKAHNCSYCRLTYESDRLSLEAMLVLDTSLILEIEIAFQNIALIVNSMDGELQINSADQNIIQIKLSLPDNYQQQITVSLSEREQEIMQLLAQGLRDQEIAQKLFISDRTVRFHINNTVTKLNARTRIQAMLKAYSQGLISKLSGI